MTQPHDGVFVTCSPYNALTPEERAEVTRFAAFLRDPDPDRAAAYARHYPDQHRAPITPDYPSQCATDPTHTGFTADPSGMLWCATCGSGCETDYTQEPTP